MRRHLFTLLAFFVSQPVMAAETITLEVIGSVRGTELLQYSQVQEFWPEECAGNTLNQGCVIENAVTLFPVVGPVQAFSEDGELFEFSNLVNNGPLDRRGYDGSARRIRDGVFEPISLSIQESSVINPHDFNFGEPNVLRIGSTSEFTIVQLFPTPVPEPSTWLMLLVGFFGIGGALRKKGKGLSMIARTT